MSNKLTYLLTYLLTVDIAKPAEEENDPGTLGKEIWSKKLGQRALDTAGERWSRQHKTWMESSGLTPVL